MISTLTFEQAIGEAGAVQRHLLLGNGFSIALRPGIFTYGSLLDQADFEDRTRIRDLFGALDTVDFESTARFLDDAGGAIPVYGEKHRPLAMQMVDDSRYLKDLLVATIAGSHPRVPSDVSESEFAACRQFLSHFLQPQSKGKVYTLNNDLLLYWTLMHTHDDAGRPLAVLSSEDGFGREEDTDPEYVEWLGENPTVQSRQRIHNLHGALHLLDTGSQLVKRTWVNTGVPLVKQTRAAMTIGHYPLFVAEGRTEQKLTKIKHSAYLFHGYKSFGAQMNQPKGALFIYGHSLAQNDEHVLRKIANGRVPQVFVGLYGDPENSLNSEIQANALRLSTRRGASYPLVVRFFDSASANVWGGNG